jgi:hypothetical protein
MGCVNVWAHAATLASANGMVDRVLFIANVLLDDEELLNDVVGTPEPGAYP